MKPHFFILLLITLVIPPHAYPDGHSPVSNTIVPSDPIPHLETGYYLVIGAYARSKEAIAKSYVNKVKRMGYDADYGFSKKKNLFFAYLHYTENFKEALVELRKHRKISEFDDCWVYVSISSDDKGKTIIQKRVKEAENGEKNTKITPEKIDNQGDIPLPKGEKTENNPEGQKPPIPDKGNTQVPEELEPETPPHPKGESMNVSGKKVYMNVYNARNNREVKGSVQLIDTERSKLIGTQEANTTSYMKNPNNGSGDMLLICDVFGYRKMQHEFNYHQLDTSKYYIDHLQDTLVVSFDLVRYVKGDLATMYNVYFYKDAAIMIRSSEFELNSLLEMLHENKNYKIRIHGHTNGNAPGKIIAPKDPKKGFFDIHNNTKEDLGSAKQLSARRAEIIKNYLIHHGIAPERMETKGWGGKRMLHDKHGTRAKKNVRVEIEILED